VKAKIMVVGSKDRAEGVALVDTGASLTLLDRRVAEAVGVELIGRKVRVVVANGHELTGELAILKKLVVDSEELLYAYTAILEFPDNLREKLRELGLINWCILGLATLELLRLIPDITTGMLRKTTALLI
jgi:predicted aspartyl protease